MREIGRQAGRWTDREGGAEMRRTATVASAPEVQDTGQSERRANEESLLTCRNGTGDRPWKAPCTFRSCSCSPSGTRGSASLRASSRLGSGSSVSSLRAKVGSRGGQKTTPSDFHLQALPEHLGRIAGGPRLAGAWLSEERRTTHDRGREGRIPSLAERR